MDSGRSSSLTIFGTGRHQLGMFKGRKRLVLGTCWNQLPHLPSINRYSMF